MAFIEMEELLMSLESGITRLNAAREKLADSKARERLTKLFDEGTFTELDAFNDSAEVIIGYGIIEGAPAYAFAPVSYTHLDVYKRQYSYNAGNRYGYRQRIS